MMEAFSYPTHLSQGVDFLLSIVPHLRTDNFRLWLRFSLPQSCQWAILLSKGIWQKGPSSWTQNEHSWQALAFQSSTAVRFPRVLLVAITLALLGLISSIDWPLHSGLLEWGLLRGGCFFIMNLHCNSHTRAKYNFIASSQASYIPWTWLTTGCELLSTFRSFTLVSKANCIPLIKASYSAILLVIGKAKCREFEMTNPFGPSSTAPAPLWFGSVASSTCKV